MLATAQGFATVKAVYRILDGAKANRLLTESTCTSSNTSLH